MVLSIQASRPAAWTIAGNTLEEGDWQEEGKQRNFRDSVTGIIFCKFL